MPFLGVTTPVITGKFHGTTRSCGARIHNLAGPQCGQNRWVSTGTVHPKMVNPCFLNGTYSPFLLNRPTNYCNSFRSNFVGVFVFIQKTFPKQKRVAFFSQLPPKSTQPTSLKPPGMFFSGTDPTLAQAGMMPVSVIWIMVSTLKGDQKNSSTVCVCAKINV